MPIEQIHVATFRDAHRFDQLKVVQRLRSEFFADDSCALHHRAQLCERDFLWKVQAATVRQNEDTIRGDKLQRLANAFGDNVRGLDFMRLHIDDADPELELVRKFFKQLEVFSTAPRNFTWRCSCNHVNRPAATGRAVRWWLLADS